MPLLALLTAPFVFPGGDPGDLGRSLADWSGRPTVALVQGGERSGPYEVGLADAGDGKDLVRLLGVKGRVEAKVDPSVMAIWDAQWRPTTLDRMPLEPALPVGFAEAFPRSSWLKGGKLTVRLKPGQALRVSSLASLPWSRPLKIHWLLARLWVVPTASGASEEAFLKGLAAATSGALKETDAGWNVELDPRAYRRRALMTVQRGAWPELTPELSRSSRELAFEAWSAASDDSIVRLYLVPGQLGEFKPVTDRRMTEMARRRLLALESFVKNPPQDSRQSASAYAGLLGQITLDRPVKYGLSQNLAANLLWPREGGGSVFL